MDRSVEFHCQFFLNGVAEPEGNAAVEDDLFGMEIVQDPSLAGPVALSQNKHIHVQSAGRLDGGGVALNNSQSGKRVACESRKGVAAHEGAIG